MEEKTIITNPLNEKLVLDTHLLFEWKCLEKKVVGGNIQFTFSRDDTKPYHKELVELENIFDPGLVFEPIHRVFFNVPEDVFLNELKKNAESVSGIVPQSA